MNKKVLAIYYTQSGQLGQIINSFILPFKAQGITVEEVMIKPQTEFVFPWTSPRFFDAMPESVLATPVTLQPFQLKETAYDLIVFGYQPWYLSASIPANALLHHPTFTTILKNTPVVTVIGARNMWIVAQEKVKKLLSTHGAKLVGNIALVDKNNNHISAITILYWMLTGKKDKKWGIFPTPGISAKDINNAHFFGETVIQHLQSNNWDALQPTLIQQKAVEIKSNLLFIETRAAKLFSIWANVIKKKKNRATWLVIFKYYLLIALFIIAPVILLINNVLFKPFLGKIINKKKQYYSGVN